MTLHKKDAVLISILSCTISVIFGTVPPLFRRNPHSIESIHLLNQSELLNTVWLSNHEDYVRLHPDHNFLAPRSWNCSNCYDFDQQNTSVSRHLYDHHHDMLVSDHQEDIYLKGNVKSGPVLDDGSKNEPAQSPWEEFDMESEIAEYDSFVDFDVDPMTKTFLRKSMSAPIRAMRRDEIQYRLVSSPPRQQPSLFHDLAPPVLCCMFILAMLAMASVVQRNY